MTAVEVVSYIGFAGRIVCGFCYGIIGYQMRPLVKDGTPPGFA